MRWASVTTIILGAGTALVTASPYVLPLVQNRNIWAGVSLISILLFTSGHMFNHIRKVPYVAGDGHGGISYFAGSFQSQYGLETQIVAALCRFPHLFFNQLHVGDNLTILIFRRIDGILAFCAISLAVKVPRIADSRSQQVAVLAWAGVLFVLYSFLMSVFRIKNGGYPFSLPPFM